MAGICMACEGNCGVFRSLSSSILCLVQFPNQTPNRLNHNLHGSREHLLGAHCWSHAMGTAHCRTSSPVTNAPPCVWKLAIRKSAATRGVQESSCWRCLHVQHNIKLVQVSAHKAFPSFLPILFRNSPSGQHTHLLGHKMTGLCMHGRSSCGCTFIELQ